MCAQNTDNALEFNGVAFKTIVEKCEGCGRIRAVEGQNYCSSYTNPAAKWSLGICNFATHAKIASAAGQGKVNPLKAAKRAAKGKGK